MYPVGDGRGSVLISTLSLKSLWKPRSFILCKWDLGRVCWILVLFPSYHKFPRNASVSEILNIYFCNSENLSQDLVSQPQLWAFLLACDLLSFFPLLLALRACVHPQSLQSCPTLCNSTDCSPPSSSVHGILRARILEWVDMRSSRRPFQPRDWTRVSRASITASRFFTAKPPGKPFHCPLFHPNLFYGMSQEDSLTEFWSAAPASDTASVISHLSDSDSSWCSNSTWAGLLEITSTSQPDLSILTTREPGHLLEPLFKADREALGRSSLLNEHKASRSTGRCGVFPDACALVPGLGAENSYQVCVLVSFRAALLRVEQVPDCLPMGQANMPDGKAGWACEFWESRVDKRGYQPERMCFREWKTTPFREWGCHQVLGCPQKPRKWTRCQGRVGELKSSRWNKQFLRQKAR